MDLICFGILFLPTYYLSFRCLKSYFNSYVKNHTDAQFLMFYIKQSIVIGVVITTVTAAVLQLKHITKEINVGTLDKMNERYNQLYSEFPIVFQDEVDNVLKRNLAGRYFNFWQNELRACKDNSMPENFMNTINHGACKNMEIFPELIEQYDWWKNNDAFHHDKLLLKQIDIIKSNAKNQSCKKIPKTNSCEIVDRLSN